MNLKYKITRIVETLLRIKSREDMTVTEFNDVMELSLEQAEIVE